MPVKKIVTSTVPHKNIPHYFQLSDSAPVAAFIGELSRQAFAQEKLLQVSKQKSILTVITELTWISRAESDNSDRTLYSAYPDYIAARDAHHENNGIIWTVTYEEV